MTGREPTFELYRAGRTTPEIQLAIRMVLCSRRWRALLDEKLRAIGQSAARMEAMAAIMNAPPPSSQADIAKRLRIEGPTMTRMIDALARDGLVKRSPAPNDRRTKYLALTQEGFAALEEIFAVYDDMRGRLLSDVAPEEVAALNGFFERVLARLDAGLPDLDGETA